MIHEMPELPYAMEALTPNMSKETLEYHYGKHLRTYIDNLNKQIQGTPYESMNLEKIVRQANGDIFNNAAQTWNHTFFFNNLTPERKTMKPKLITALTREFGSVESFKEEFTRAATNLFGAGWVWLVKDKQNKLSILSESNAGTPIKEDLKPILVIDVWEHAYYIDYRNRRADYINAFWDIVNWDIVADRCVPKKYSCTACDYIYDPEKGSPETGIHPGTAFEDIPDGWTCPLCGLYKNAFVAIED